MYLYVYEHLLKTIFAQLIVFIQRHLQLFEDRNYVIKIEVSKCYKCNENILLMLTSFVNLKFDGNSAKTIHILFRLGATVEDIIESYAHAFEVRMLLTSGSCQIGESADFQRNQSLLSTAREQLDRPGGASTFFGLLCFIANSLFFFRPCYS